MKDCTYCKYADWQRTKSGRLSPSGDGRCQYQWKIPPLPASMYFALSVNALTPSGGHISRKTELKEHCAYYCSTAPSALGSIANER